MKMKQYGHGVAFEETFTVTLTGGIEGNPVGWGCVEHETKWLQNSLHIAVRDALQRFYQCRMVGTKIEVKVTS